MNEEEVFTEFQKALDEGASGTNAKQEGQQPRGAECPRCGEIGQPTNVLGDPTQLWCLTCKYAWRLDRISDLVQAYFEFGAAFQGAFDQVVYSVRLAEAREQVLRDVVEWLRKQAATAKAWPTVQALSNAAEAIDARYWEEQG
jgi:hypothetical protein